MMRFAVSALTVVIMLTTSTSVRHAAAEGDLLKEAVGKLSGATSRTWLFGDVTHFMGATDTCTEFETDRFSADHTLSTRRCVDGKSVDMSRRWTLRQDGPIDLVVVIDDASYQLSFKDEGTKHFMRLRQRSNSKTTPTIDRTFRLSDD